MSMIGVAIAGFFGMVGAASQASAMRGATAQAARQADRQEARLREEMQRLEEQRQRYRKFEFFNPYANLENPFKGMENVYEDLTVSQEAARFQMEQGTQQRANIMQQMRGAAGGSGIAGLAQVLAQQGTLQARQVSADIAQQEAANQSLSAQGAAQIQQLQRQADSALQMAEAGGEMAMQEAEMQRQATLLGTTMMGAAGASAGVQQAYANQMSMNMAGAQMAGSGWDAVGTAAGAADWSNMNWGGNNTITTTTQNTWDPNIRYGQPIH